MSRPICDPNSDGRDWLHRGISISDQRGAWPHVAGKWCVHHPDGIMATPTLTKKEAVETADKLVDAGVMGRTTCPDCTGQLVEHAPIDTDWYGVLQYADCKDCKQAFVSRAGGEYELSA
jgi:hypothetical protein